MTEYWETASGWILKEVKLADEKITAALKNLPVQESLYPTFGW